MALLLETTLGDLVIDLDVEGSPALCQNILQLAQARYYTQTLIYNISVNRFCQLGDPHGNGTGGACWQGVIDACSNGNGGDVTRSQKRFLKSTGRRLTPLECQERGRVVATEIKGIPDTIGSQFLITLAEGPGMALDGYSIVDHDTTNAADNASSKNAFLSLGKVTEDDNNVLDQLSNLYCDKDGRPFADVRVKRALVIYNPFEEPPEMKQLMKLRGVEFDSDNDTVMASPDYERPPEERVEPRIPVDQVDMAGDVDEVDEQELAKLHQQQTEQALQQEAKSRAVVLEMLGDLPSAEIKAPENVLFVCKLNPVTEDEDLELIFSRFDPQVKAEIIRDHDTGASLQYAFVEFTKKQQAVEAYFKMNNALVDDRRIKVDFSQSVAKLWDKYHQQLRPSALPDHYLAAGRGGRGGRGDAARGRDGGRGGRGGRAGRGGGRYYNNNHDNERGRREYDRRNSNNNNLHNNEQRHASDYRGGRNSGDMNGGDGRGRNYQRHDGRQPHHDKKNNSPRSRERDYSSSALHRRPTVDEFGRARVPSSERNNDHNHRRQDHSILAPADGHRNRHEQRRDKSRSRSGSMSRSRSRSPGTSPEQRRRDRSRSRSRDRSRSRKHRHKSSKKKKHKHHDDHRDRRHRHRGDKSESPDRRDRDSKRSKRRYDSDDDQDNGNGAKDDHEQKGLTKRRYDSDSQSEEDDARRESSRKHHKRHKHRKRSRSFSR